jgi:hypothetical protein
MFSTEFGKGFQLPHLFLLDKGFDILPTGKPVNLGMAQNDASGDVFR